MHSEFRILNQNHVIAMTHFSPYKEYEFVMRQNDTLATTEWLVKHDGTQNKFGTEDA